MTMHRRSTTINGWFELGNQFREVEWQKCSSARFCNVIVFPKKYSRTPRPISRLTSPVSPQLQKKSNVMQGKDFLDMFQALYPPWDSQNFLKLIMEIRSYILSSISIAQMKRSRSIRLSVPGLIPRYPTMKQSAQV